MTEETHSSTHPLLPPPLEEDRLAWLRLLRSSRVGPATFWRLMGTHGSAGAALAELPRIARAAGVDGYRPCTEAVALAEMKAGHRAGARLLCRGAPDYPPALSMLDDPPPLLWAKGDLTLAQRPAVALVGARNASSLGLRMARALARDLGQDGLAIVSGLARGIDTAAHLAALDSGTLAVLPGGLGHPYPPENLALADSLAQRGLLISEQPMGLQPQARHFPRRNRLIAGLSLAVVVVEAAARSGSLITARDALDLGREVMAVPGHPFDPRAAGCNQLLRDGAVLVRGARDVRDALPPDAPAQGVLPLVPDPAAPTPAKPGPGSDLRRVAALHQQILDRLSPAPLAEDQLIRDLHMVPAALAPALLDLELSGRIERQPGGLLARRQ